jgi:hypothetical protein
VNCRRLKVPCPPPPFEFPISVHRGSIPIQTIEGNLGVHLFIVPGLHVPQYRLSNLLMREGRTIDKDGYVPIGSYAARSSPAVCTHTHIHRTHIHTFGDDRQNGETREGSPKDCCKYWYSNHPIERAVRRVIGTHPTRKASSSRIREALLPSKTVSLLRNVVAPVYFRSHRIDVHR